MTPEQITKRFQSIKGNRQIVNDIWDSIELYIAPYRGRFFKDERSENSIQWRRPFVYDATAIMASQNLASSLHSRLTSASTMWFGLKFRTDELNDSKEAVEWLEECGNLCFEALQDSNFNVEVNETYQDLVNFGTSVIVEEANTDDGDSVEINFQSVPIKECYFEEDHKGGILNFYRHMQWTPKQILDFFGKDDIPFEIAEAAEDEAHDPDQKIDIIFCIYRRQEIKIDPSAKTLSADKRPWGYKYVTLNSAEMLGEGGGYYENPAFIPRWRKTSSSMWGNSPAMVALADTLTLNRTIELNLTAVEKTIDPPIITSNRGLIGDLNLQAGGLSVARNIDEVRPFQQTARFDVTYQEMDRLRQNIESYFFIPQLILPPMQDQGNPVSATEISVRMQQLEALIGPTLGRLQVDLLDPIVERTFNILNRAGSLPEMPSVVSEMGGAIEIEYTSPIAKTQEASNVQALERWLMSVLGMAEGNPEVMDIPDWDACIKSLADMMGVRAKNINSKEAIEALRNKRAEIQKMQQQGEAMQAAGDGMAAMNNAQGAPQ